MQTSVCNQQPICVIVIISTLGPFTQMLSIFFKYSFLVKRKSTCPSGAVRNVIQQQGLFVSRVFEEYFICGSSMLYQLVLPTARDKFGRDFMLGTHGTTMDPSWHKSHNISDLSFPHVPHHLSNCHMSVNIVLLQMERFFDRLRVGSGWNHNTTTRQVLFQGFLKVKEMVQLFSYSLQLCAYTSQFNLFSYNFARQIETVSTWFYFKLAALSCP